MPRIEAQRFLRFERSSRDAGESTEVRPVFARALDAFVGPEEAAPVCAAIALIFRDHGSREARGRSRLAFLVEERGVAWFREELERRLERALPPAGRDARVSTTTDHVGVFRQRKEAES
jgi:sulfite reductase beta subunit-like hemoprotein